MAPKPMLPSEAVSSATELPSPRSRRQELLDALTAETANPVHSRILNAYALDGTVEAAEREFGDIVEEIINET